jgi:Protein of unknown function (DUF2851)
MGKSPRVAEITLSAAWHAGAVPARLVTTVGVSLEIIHRGTWSHGLGPDFRDALILFDGRELRAGSIEIHLRTRGWGDHGHHLDPAYDTVALHLVGQHDGTETRRLDGGIVPVAVIGPIDRFAVPEFAAWDWHSVGGATCASRLSATRPESARELLRHLGDVRLAARSARLEGRLSAEPPGQVLWSELLDGLGFAMNREPMRELARAVSLSSIEALLHAMPSDCREGVARGVLLGVAGFLPLSAAEAHLGGLTTRDVAELETHWFEHGAPWREETIPATVWNRSRVRPTNHPVPRLLAAARLLASASAQSGALPTILGVVLEPADPIERLRALTGNDARPGIGSDRAIDILASGIIPLALALAAHSGDLDLADAASRHWERLPAPSLNAVTRRAARQVAGASLLGKIGARGAQGLIQLDTVLCQPRRCFECPIAAAELSVNG